MPSSLVDQRIGRVGRVELTAAGLLIFAFSFLLVGLHVRAYTSLSPTDELQHFDYAEKISRGVMPRLGDRLGEVAMREESCRGIDAYFFPPPCDSPSLSPDQFQEDGFATAAGQMPVYYGLTGVTGRLLRWLLGADSLLTGMRLAGGMWLAAGLFALWCVLRTAAVSASTSASIVGLVGSAPVVLEATAVLNPDAQLLVGGSLLLLAMLHLPDRRGAVALAVVSAIGVFSEGTMVLAVGLVAVYCVLRAAHLWRRSGGRVADDISGYLAAGSAALFGAAIGAGAVVVTSHLIGGTDPGLAVPKNRQFHVAQIPWHQIARQATAMVTPVRAVPAAAALRGDLNSLLRVALDRVLLAALVLGAVANRGASRRAAFAGSTLAVMVIGGPALAAETSIVGHQFFPIPPRYGLPLLPGAALSLGQAASGRRAGIALGVFAVATVAVTMGCLALG